MQPPVSPEAAKLPMSFSWVKDGILEDLDFHCVFGDKKIEMLHNEIEKHRKVVAN